MTACHPSRAVRHLTPPQVQETGGKRIFTRYLPINFTEVRDAMEQMSKQVEPLIKDNEV